MSGEQFMNEYFVVLLVHNGSNNDEHVEKLFIRAFSGEEAARKAKETFNHKSYVSMLKDIRKL